MMCANIEESTYEDKPKFKKCLSPISSSRANMPSSDSIQLEAVQTFPKGPKSAPSLTNDEKSYEDEPEFKYCSSPLLSPCTGSHSSDSIHPKAMYTDLTAWEVPRVISSLAKVNEHQFDIHLGHQVLVEFIDVLRDTSPILEQSEMDDSTQENPV